MEITLRILCLLVGYLLGSFLTAECIARRLTDRSARDLGSGNPGMANIMATLGKGPGFAVLAGDVAKTVLACGLCWLLAATDLSLHQRFPTIRTIGHLSSPPHKPGTEPGVLFVFTLP